MKAIAHVQPIKTTHHTGRTEEGWSEFEFPDGIANPAAQVQFDAHGKPWLTVCYIELSQEEKAEVHRQQMRAQGGGMLIR